MKLGNIASVCKILTAEREYHVKQRAYYSRLFGLDRPPVRETDFTAEHFENTPLQEWYQKRAEHHAAELFKVDVAIQKFLETAETTLLT